MQYIVLDVILRATEKNFGSVHIRRPFQTNGKIRNGNRTEWSPVSSVITTSDKQKDETKQALKFSLMEQVPTRLHVYQVLMRFFYYIP